MDPFGAAGSNKRKAGLFSDGRAHLMLCRELLRGRVAEANWDVRDCTSACSAALDEWSRDSLAIEVDVSLTGERPPPLPQ